MAKFDEIDHVALTVEVVRKIQSRLDSLSSNTIEYPNFNSLSLSTKSNFQVFYNKDLNDYIHSMTRYKPYYNSELFLLFQSNFA